MLPRISGVTLCLLSIFLIHSCQKDSPAPTPVLSTITTTTISAITQTTAVSGGNITSDGGASVTARGVCWSTTANPSTSDSKTTDGTGTGQFVSSLSGLTPGTTYHIRAYATNSVGTAYGADIIISTSGQAPSCITQPASKVLANGAILNGIINAYGLSTTVTFEYGTTTSYGSTVTATQSPVTGNTDTNVSAEITGLTSGTTYLYRIKAVNSLGTTYGSDVTFITTATDVDGNIYNAVTIGTQVWMKENLKTTKYRNGDFIGTTTPATLDISGENTPKYQWAYNGNESNVATYGRLYTWYAVTDSRNVCPTGWHVPSDVEWTKLTDYLTNNGYGYGGSGSDIAKSMAATSGWTTYLTSGSVGNDQESNNSSGFTAIPSGYRYYYGAYYDIGFYVYWWSSMEESTSYAWGRGIGNYDSSVTRDLGYKEDGVSVRCLRD